MSETHQLVSGGDPEVALYDGIAFYESGEVYKALSCWRDLLRQVPGHEVAQHYIQFVQGYLGISDQAGEREVGAAQRREANKLRGSAESTPAVSKTQTHYADENAPPPESIRPRRGAAREHTQPTALGVIQVDASSAPTSAPAPSPESVVSPVAVAAQSAVEKLARSQTAVDALSGPKGPRTQADGLTVKALSRQLAAQHRSGKYEEAVETAKQLLSQDPQHVIARRYIDEYHRQKRAALQEKSKRAAKTSAPTSAPTAAPVAASPATSAGASAPQAVSSTRSFVSSKEGVSADASPAGELKAFPASAGVIGDVDDGSEAPTAAPINAPPPSASPELIPDLNAMPQVKLSPDQISWQEFDHRAGFFTGEVDGNTSYEDLIMISGMPRDQALKILTQLVQSGVIG